MTLSPSESAGSTQSHCAHFLIEISCISPLDSVPGLRILFKTPYFLSQWRITTLPHLCHPHYKQWAHCPVSREINVMALAFEERKRFIARSTDKDMGGSSSSNLSPQSGIQTSFYELGQADWCVEMVVNWFWLQGFGIWPCMVSRQSRFNNRSSLNSGPSTSERLLGSRFWSHWGPLVLWGRTWFQVLSEVRMFFLHALAARFEVLFCCLWRTTQHLVRNRIRPVWAGSAVIPSFLLSFSFLPRCVFLLI